MKVLAAALSPDAPGGAPHGTFIDDRLTIACGEGAIRLERLQKAGGKPLAATDFLRGTPVPTGTVAG